jgi:hypothetical protein
MRPIDHFLSTLEKLANSLTPGTGLDKQNIEHLSGEFTALVGPVIGADAADDLFTRALDRIGARGIVKKAGALAAFFLGEFDDDTMSLGKNDWEDVQETLEEVSGEMDMDTLTELMQDLLSRGVL